MSSKYALLEPEKPDFRMVLVGRTGVGKSASGNTILGRRAFESMASPSSLTSVCQKEEAAFEGKLLAVVDTPGLFDTNQTEEEVIKEIVSCISFSAPGPHVFLVVIQPNRFTEEEQKAVNLIQQIFGEQAARYTMVLFTRGDDLEDDGISIEEFIHKNKDLRDFVRQCGGRYHVFNNRNQDRSQVRELLKKISTMVQRNRGSFYTNEMLEGAEMAIKEEMKRLRREDPNMTPQVARRQAETENKFNKEVLAVLVAGDRATAATVSAVAVGGAIGSVGGPVGAAFGAAVGFAVAGITVAVKKKKGCVIQ